ncbi:suf-1 [Pristionchus pacificus]|uniref:Suf-1 n=1 Tax=Pristionchus pacificus TaxID=54126 RepID=A0A2A6CXE8_PRIPA|nr:suf-1 [Pristionchus pacificus]|eukprot:PDM82808.1 suf-1 [Pristionchus pacificus]
MASSSVVSPERRIELNAFDVDAWNLLLRENHARAIEQARPFYEKLVGQFPNAGRYWKAYIEHELRSKNFENVEALFSRCLVHVLNIDLWKCYVFYVRETKGHLPSFREKMAKAYDFALDKVGLDLHAHTMYTDYISFLKGVPAVGQYAENQRITAVRKVYQRAIVTPMMNIDKIWDEYQQYEKSVNPTLAEKLIMERNKDFQISRRIARQLEQITRGINRQAVSVPSRGTVGEMKQVELWKKFIQWEKGNPMDTEEYGAFARRVIYAFEQALLCLGYYPEIWYEAALFMQKAAQELEIKGDVKQASAMREEAILVVCWAWRPAPVGSSPRRRNDGDDGKELFERSISGLMKESQLLYFAYADFQEERKLFDEVKSIYEKIFALEHVDPTLAFIQLMKFVRRTEGVKAARAIFKKAREDERSKHQIYVAHALQEYYCSKDKDVAMRIFDLGLKKYGEEPEYCLAYVNFLTHLNEDNNTRVVFERILTGGALANDRSGEIWDKYLEFESLVGDLASTLKVDSRRRDAALAVCKEAAESCTTLMLIDRYRFLNLVPCSPEQLRLMGYNKPLRAVSASGAPSAFTGVGVAGGNGGGAGTAPGPSGGVMPHRAGITVPAGPSSVMGGGTNIEITGYPRPDTTQMIPFKPKRIPIGAPHTVPGGVFPPPPAAAYLLTILPPPTSFSGPFVIVDALIAQLAKFDVNEPGWEPARLSEKNGSLGRHKTEDIKRDMYQLLATTTDPKTALAAGDHKRKRGAESDDDEDKMDTSGTRDVFKRRMNQRQQD